MLIVFPLRARLGSGRFSLTFVFARVSVLVCLSSYKYYSWISTTGFDLNTTTSSSSSSSSCLLCQPKQQEIASFKFSFKQRQLFSAVSRLAKSLAKWYNYQKNRITIILLRTHKPFKLLRQKTTTRVFRVQFNRRLPL